MKPYASIETVFTRDHSTNILEFGIMRCPENRCIKDWTLSEKIDGTNIRATVTLAGIEVKGRTEKADLPPLMYDAVLKALPPHDLLVAYFASYRGKELPTEWSVTFYGEGYGAGIQKGGCYSDVKRFRCFDLLLGESWWTSDAEMRRVCNELGIPVAPHLCFISQAGIPVTEGELAACCNLRHGMPYSQVAAEDRGVFDVIPEGIVAKPLEPLFNRHGERVMWKLTFREYNKQPKGQKQPNIGRAALARGKDEGQCCLKS